jgi:hypothetical protein
MCNSRLILPHCDFPSAVKKKLQNICPTQLGCAGDYEMTISLKHSVCMYSNSFFKCVQIGKRCEKERDGVDGKYMSERDTLTL